MQGEQPTVVEVGEHGVLGDRRYGVVDLETGRTLSAKWEPRLLAAQARTVAGGVAVDLPDGRQADDEALSAWLGRPVALREAGPGVRGTYQSRLDPLDDRSDAVEWQGPEGSFVDAAPVHVVTTASLRAMASRAPGHQWDARRFRPNLVLDVDGEGFVEDGWLGALLRIGEVVLAPYKRTTRCSMIGRPQPGGLDRDPAVVRAVRDHHGYTLGVHARVVAGGPVAVGARVEHIEG